VLHSNKHPYSNIEVNVVPSSAPVDHTFRYYESQNSHVSLYVPPFLQLDQYGVHAVLSRANAVIDIDRKTGAMIIQTKTEEENTVSEMTLFVYNDQYRENLLATCAIEIHSMITIYTRVKAGLQTTQSLSLPSESARSVMIHSSNPNLAYLPRRENNRIFRVIPQTVNHIQVCVKTFLPTQQRIKLHCTGKTSYFLRLI